MTKSKPSDWTAFIHDNTKLLSPPLVPEIRLHLAEESLPIWQKTEEELGEINVPPPFWAFAWAGGQALARYLLDNPALVVGKTCCDAVDVGPIGEVGRKDLAADPVAARELRGQGVESVAVAGDEHEVEPPPGELLGESTA